MAGLTNIGVALRRSWKRVPAWAAATGAIVLVCVVGWIAVVLLPPSPGTMGACRAQCASRTAQLVRDHSRSMNAHGEYLLVCQCS